MSEQKLVPELRFPVREAFEISRLDELVQFSSGGTPSKDNQEYWQGDIPWISASTMHDDEIYSSGLNISEEGLRSGSRLAPKNSILLLVRGSMLYNRIPICMALREVAFNQDVKALKAKSHCSSRYLFYWLKAKEHKLLSMVVGTGIGAGKLETSELQSMTVSYPTKLGQQKIADFLSSVDTKLAKLSRKKTLLEDYKRSLMQQIFSQKLRFKQDNGSEFPEWELCLFSDLYSWVRTNNLSREFLTNQISKVQNIHYGDIHTRFPALFRQSNLSIPYIESEAFISTILNEEYCRVGDIVIADASEDYLDIGKAIEIIQVEEHSLVAGLHTYIARPKRKLALGFSGYMMRSPSVRRSIQQIAQGVSVLGVSKTNIGLIEITVPVYEEQQKIADFLSSFDQKIDVVSKQIEQLETFKKGLLQKLFV